MQPQVLLVNGTVGVGKTAVGQEIARQVGQQRQGAAFVDLDTLAYVTWPRDDIDPFHFALMFRNLAAIWPNLWEAGVRRLILAGVVPSTDHFARYREAVPDAAIRHCRLIADSNTRRRRLAAREAEVGLEWHLERTDTLEAELTAAALPGVVVENEGSVRQTAARVRSAIGW